MKNKLIKVKNGLRVTQDKAITLWKKACAAVTTLTITAMTAVPASAAGVNDSNIVKGTEKLIGDVTTWLMVLAPVVAGMLIIYFCIRRSAADEMDQKKWNNRIVVAVVSCIGAVLGAATLNLILGYYR
jgi:ABC-type molybdate transport system permease subunit